MKAFEVMVWVFALTAYLEKQVKALKAKYFPTLALFNDQDKFWKVWNPVHAGFLLALNLSENDPPSLVSQAGRGLRYFQPTMPEAEQRNFHGTMPIRSAVLTFGRSG